ncbi:MAG TPA: hypothetical protein VH062_32590 [Polyangiaceae bacterium]|nr:hypothetical protein [Polyangiaceae bacterium]
MSKTAISPSAPKTVSRSDSATAATAKAPATAARADAGPPAKVDISSEGRARLRAAGAATSDIARVNLNDARAVDRAVLKARAQRLTAQPHAAAPKESATPEKKAVSITA